MRAVEAVAAGRGADFVVVGPPAMLEIGARMDDACQALPGIGEVGNDNLFARPFRRSQLARLASSTAAGEAMAGAAKIAAATPLCEQSASECPFDVIVKVCRPFMRTCMPRMAGISVRQDHV